MAVPRFRRAVEKVARPLIEPLGFEFYVQNEPGLGGAYEFLRPWKRGWMEGIALHTVPRSRAFAVELGVVRLGGFLMASPFDNMGRWREFGLRERLSRLVRDWPWDPGGLIPYHDQSSLDEAMRVAIEQAL